jgi:DNA (cytosine-5)-methyltransferase 1
MARVRHGGTAPELVSRRLLRTLRIPFETGGKGLPGTPDLVNNDQKWAIFVHGCFWHHHKSCARATIPKTNRAFWLKKFRENRARDGRKIVELKKLGYRVVIVWECELNEPGRVARKLLKLLEQTQRDTVVASDQARRETYRITNSGIRVVRSVRLDNGGRTISWVGIPPGMNGDPQSMFDQVLLKRKTAPRSTPQGKPVRVADLFSGCGGLSLGAREASRALGRPFKAVLALDKSPTSLHVYKRNFNPVHAYERDVEEVLNGEIGSVPTREEKELKRRLGRIDLMLAGPPCQGHSDLNNHTRRADDRNKLYERVARFAEVVRPSSILVENVRTIVHGKDRSLEHTLAVLLKLGYSVDTGVVNASELGVPQARRRHVLMASLRKQPKVGDIVVSHGVNRLRTVRWAIQDLAREHKNGLFTRSSHQNKANRRRIEFLFAMDRVDLPNKLRPPCHRNGGHTYKSMYGRISYDLPGATITSGFGSPGQGRFIHPTQRRTLTPHEAARLQFFPDWFKFSGVEKRTELAEMIGNAVPMKLSYAFCLELLV